MHMLKNSLDKYVANLKPFILSVLRYLLARRAKLGKLGSFRHRSQVRQAYILNLDDFTDINVGDHDTL